MGTHLLQRRHGDGSRSACRRPGHRRTVVAAVLPLLTAALVVAAAPSAVAAPHAFKVTIHLAKTQIPAGDAVRLHGRVSPKGSGKITVQRLASNGNWVTLKKVKLSGKTYSTTLSFGNPGTRVLRVLKPASGGRKAGHSGIANLKVGNARWLQVSAGKYFACGVKTNRTGWCWGDNSPSLGDLGEGTGNSSDLPVQVGTARNWASISAGNQFACGVRTNGTLWCWGNNSDGNLGNGTTGNVSESPVQVGHGTHWKNVSAANSGASFVCAVKTTGSGWCWGDNGFGELGDGTTGAGNGSDVPVQVGGGNNWVKISAGLYFGCGVQSDGTAWCWGDNRVGELGNGTTGSTTNTDTPGQVGTATWSNVSAGGFFTCGVQPNGTAWCWGLNADGELGDGSTGDTDVPTQVGSANTWSSISSGDFFACGVKTDHTGYCWGYDFYGQLGNNQSGASADADQPSQISGSGAWAKVSAGVDEGCGVQTDQTAWCWGRNDNGQLGDGSSGVNMDSAVPRQVDGDELRQI